MNPFLQNNIFMNNCKGLNMNIGSNLSLLMNLC